MRPRYGGLSFILILLGVTACSTIDQLVTRPSGTPSRTPDITLSAATRLPNGTLLPAGTLLVDSVDVTGKAFIYFRLPEGYKLVSAPVRSEKGDGAAEPYFDDAGGITCTCLSGSGGCSPFKAVGPSGTVVGCAMSDQCTECQQKTAAITPAPLGRPGVVVRTDRETDILHLAGGVSFVLGPEELDALSCPKNVVLQWTGFSKGVARFLSGFQRDNVEQVRVAASREELPSNYTMMLINAYGKVMRVPIQSGLTIAEQVARSSFALKMGVPAPRGPEDVTPARARASRPAFDEAAGTSCKCLSGQSGCIYAKRSAPLIGYAEWCEAGECQSCQMSS